MDDYRRILEILDSARDIRITLPDGTIRYIMRPENRETILYHLTELYAIVLDIGEFINSEAIDTLLDEVDPLEDQNLDDFDGDDMDFDLEGFF